ncbi:hypothetical protein BGZ97_007022, partial [Linnemannia gamsii]
AANNKNRHSGESEALTEVLTVEFRSSDQSDDYDDMDEDDYFDEVDEELYEDDGDLYNNDQDNDDDHRLYSGSGDSTEEYDDGFEESSEDSFYDSEYDSEYSDSADEEEGYPVEDGEQGQSQRQSTVETVGGKNDAEVEGPAISSSTQAQLEDLPSECHLPSPAFSPRSGKAANQGGSGSFGSRLGLSAGSSAASRARARGTRPGLPDFQAGFNANNSKVNPSPLQQTSFSGGVSAAGAGAGTPIVASTLRTATLPAWFLALGGALYEPTPEVGGLDREKEALVPIHERNCRSAFKDETRFHIKCSQE